MLYKEGIKLLFWTFTQIIIIILAYTFFLRYASVHGGIGAAHPLDLIHPIITVVITIELIISVALIIKPSWFK